MHKMVNYKHNLCFINTELAEGFSAYMDLMAGEITAIHLQYCSYHNLEKHVYMRQHLLPDGRSLNCQVLFLVFS